MGLIGMYKPGCEHGISLLCVSALYMLITTVVGDGVKCTGDESICGCFFKNETGGLSEISMSKINNDVGPPIFSNLRGKSGAFIYFINPCTGFIDGGCSDVTGCQESTNKANSYTIAKPGTYSFGSYTKGQPLRVTYAAVGVRQMTLILTCTDDVTPSAGTVDDTSKKSGISQYIVTISSKQVCPKPYKPPPPSKTSSRLSTGSILVIVFFVVLVIYLVSGILFMKYKRGATGTEVIPNVEFWSSIPGLVKDGCVFFGTKVKGLCQGLCQRGGYNEI